MDRAFVTGLTGQDGSYMAELLLEKGYEVHGLARPGTSTNTWGGHTGERLSTALSSTPTDRLHVHHGDLTDRSRIDQLVKDVAPDEIYHLGAQSDVGESFTSPMYTTEVNSLATLQILESIRKHDLDAKFYQASTSELYGNSSETVLDENSPFRPRSPYAVSKLHAYWATVNYRESYDVFASNGILFNHESPRRIRTAVTRKIAQGAVEVVHGKRDVLSLGNLDSKRDWGYAPEFVEAIWKILNHSEPMDVVIATGESHSVREFVERAFGFYDIDVEWHGERTNERGVNPETGETLVEVDEEYFRPADIGHLRGDPSLAAEVLDWEPETSFDELVELMVESEQEKIGRDRPRVTGLASGN